MKVWTSWGKLNAAHLDALRPFVSGRVVHDVCSGPEFPLAGDLLELGAKKVVAIDKERRSARSRARVEYYHMRLHEFKGKAAVVMLSWPPNHAIDGLLGILERARVVIYLGSNTGGNACGTPALFRHLIRRELLAYVPHSSNSMIVVGDSLGAPRAKTGEECAALQDDMITFGAAEQLAESDGGINRLDAATLSERARIKLRLRKVWPPTGLSYQDVCRIIDGG